MMAAGFGTSFALTGSTATVMAGRTGGVRGGHLRPVPYPPSDRQRHGCGTGGSLLAMATTGAAGLRTSMAVGALGYPTAAGLAWLCVPARRTVA